MSEDETSNERFKVMERKLFYGIMTPGAILTIIFGVWLLSYGFWGTWMLLKLILVGVLIGYHFWCGIMVANFKKDANRHSHVFFRWMNEVPVLFLFAIVILVVVKPTF